MSYKYQYEYGKDFGTLRSFLGQSEEQLADKLSTNPETIRKIESSIDLLDIDENNIFKIYYFAKTIEEYPFNNNRSLNALAGNLANQAANVIKVLEKKNKEARRLLKEEEILKKVEEMSQKQQENIISEIIKENELKEDNDLDEYKFLDLLLSTMIVRNYQPPIVDLDELEKDLYQLKSKVDFTNLFKNIAETEDKVELSDAFNKASELATLIHISVKSENKIYLINITEEQAKNNIKKYEQADILKMVILVDRLKEKSVEHEQARGPILQKIQTIKKYED